MRLKTAFVVLSVAALAGCAYPKTIHVYDAECQIVARQMVLDFKHVGEMTGCTGNQDCIGQVVGRAALLATSTVVSGSIVVAGNVVYWLQKAQDCRPARVQTTPAALAS